MTESDKEKGFPSKSHIQDVEFEQKGRTLEFRNMTAQSQSDDTIPCGLYMQAMTIFEKLEMTLWNMGGMLKNVRNLTVRLAESAPVDELNLALNVNFPEDVSVTIVEGDFKDDRILIKVDCLGLLLPTKIPTLDLRRRNNLNSGEPKAWWLKKND